MKKGWMLAALLLLASLARAGEKAYLFTYFTGNGEDGLHLAYSRDGFRWMPIKGGASLLTPAVGDKKLMRDPSVVQGPDGTFHMVWTPGWHEQFIGYAHSEDLIHWSEQKAIPVMTHEPTARNSWAPELFYDKPSKTYYILWASTLPGRFSGQDGGENMPMNHRIYATTTRDFQTFTPTELFFDPGFSVIDAAIVRDQKKGLLMIVKNEVEQPVAQKNLRVTRTRRIGDGFPTEVSEPIHADPYWAEGPAPLWIGEWLYVYFDKYMLHRYGAVRSRDGVHWEDVSDQMSFPQGMRHGTVFAVPEKVLEKLLQLEP